MSTSSQKFDVLKHRKPLRESFDDILVLADDFLKDECPISEVDEWLFRIDDSLLQLKLWRETIGVEQGLLEDIVLDKDLCDVVGKVLRSMILPLHEIEMWCEDPETVRLPQMKSRISAAIDEFQASTNSLTDTTDLLRNYKAKSNETGLKTLHIYGHHVPLFSQKDEEQQRIPGLYSPDMRDPVYLGFLKYLGKLSDEEKQIIRIGELPVLHQQILYSMRRLGSLPSNINDSRKEELSEVAVTLSHFYAAWLETTSTTNSAGSDTTSRVHGLPRMAKIWLILHNMGSEHFLDSFCASRITDESLPLDVLTIESILPLHKKLSSSQFYAAQFNFVTPPQGFASRRDLLYQGSRSIDESYLKLPEASSGKLSVRTLSGASFDGTTTPTVGPPVKETAWNQPTSIKQAFARTPSDTGGSAVEETALDKPASTKKDFASTSSHSNDPSVD